MQFDVTGLLIFLGFVLPGFLAQKARRSLVPSSLKPLSPVAEVGEFVLTGVWVHVLLLFFLGAIGRLFSEHYFTLLIDTLFYATASNFLRAYRVFVFGYIVGSLFLGYCVGFIQGLLVLKQPIRTWLVNKRPVAACLTALGISGFLQDDPVWYFVLKQVTPDTVVFLEIEMKDGAGFYTGKLRTYGILDDSEKAKDFLY